MKICLSVLLLATILLSLSVAATTAYAQELPVDCATTSIEPSTIPAGQSIIRVSGSGCVVPTSSFATVIVWTPFGNSAFGGFLPLQPQEPGSSIVGYNALRGGSFSVLVGLYNAFPGNWDVTVQIFQDGQVVNQGSAGTLTVL
jgi:hypothetical protein